VDVVAAGSELVEARGIDAVAVRRAPGDRVQRDVRDLASVERPHVETSLLVHDARCLVAPTRGHVGVEEPGRFHHVVVDAHEDEVVDRDCRHGGILTRV
jgi:hypothetical protein